MTAHPLPLAVAVAGDLRWRWLAGAVQAAGSVAGGHRGSPGQPRYGWVCCSRVATRTPLPDTRSVGPAREFTLATLHRWGLPERADDVAVVLSELFTNALRHGLPPARGRRPGWPVHLGLVWSGRYVVCAVADPGTTVPRPTEPDYFAESGRGLHVVGALSDAWGATTPTEAGKTVWALFAVGSGPPPPPPQARFSRLVSVGSPPG